MKLSLLLIPLLVANLALAAEPISKVTSIGIREQIGQSIDLNLTFLADTGEPVALGQIVNGTKPVLLTIVYFNCPSLCNLHLNGVTEALKQLRWTVGREFDLVAVSMDPRESSAVAAPKKANYVRAYERLQSADGWHFLTGSTENIQRLADQVGFGYQWDEKTKQFAHASAAIVLSPTGRITRYLHGVQPEARNFRLALVEASGGRSSSWLDRFLAVSYKFDPIVGTYTLATWNIMGMTGLLMLGFGMIVGVFAWVRHSKPRGR